MPRKHAPVTEEPINKAPEVVYLPPKPFNRQRFMLHLASIIAVVLALMLGLSIFFKVETIQVAGSDRYTPWQIQDASGIKTGDQLLTFSRGRAASRIQDKLPYVKRVRIGISLPDTVHIEIVETRVTYALQDTNGNWWRMDSDGKIVEAAPEGVGKLDVTISGVILDEPTVGEQAKAWQPPQTATDPSGELIPVTVTAAQKLAAGKTIASYLEANGIIGDVVSIDLDRIFEITMWYKDQYQILLGDTQQISLKISCLKAFLADYNTNRPYEAGILDLTDPDHIKYQSFTE
jgi:cell division protein FtsQ